MLQYFACHFCLAIRFFAVWLGILWWSQCIKQLSDVFIRNPLLLSYEESWERQPRKQLGRMGFGCPRQNQIHAAPFLIKKPQRRRRRVRILCLHRYGFVSLSQTWLPPSSGPKRVTCGWSRIFVSKMACCYDWQLCLTPFIHSFVRAHARFACLSSEWTTTTGKLLGPTICLPHKDGVIPLSALPKDTTSKLASLFFTLSFMCWAPSREAVNTICFKVFWYDSTWEMNPRITDYEADALTTTPSPKMDRKRSRECIELVRNSSSLNIKYIKE